MRKAQFFSIGKDSSPAKEESISQTTFSVERAQAAELKAGIYWKLKEDFCSPDCEYKNNVLITLQKKLIHREPSMPLEHRKQFAMQLYQENGALDIWQTGGTDKGCSYGLGQWWVCPTYSAKSYLAKHCAKNDAKKCDYDKELERQLMLLADDMVQNYRAYNGDIRLAIIAHNRPASANAGRDQCLAGPTDKDDKGKKDCYYSEQVLQHNEKFDLI